MNRAILFSGHMIDRPGRPVPRVPPDLVDRVRVELGRALDSMELGCGDVGICGAACGGDLLVAGEALDRGLRLEVFLADPEEHHLERSVSFAGEDWATRLSRTPYVRSAARAHQEPAWPQPYRSSLTAFCHWD